MTYDVTTEHGLFSLYDDAFAEVYAAAARLTRGNRSAAEDLVQDAFLRLVRAAKAGDVTEVGIGWLITTVRRRFLDRLRSSDREDRRLRLVSAGRPTSEQIEWGGDRAVASMLDGLSERERAALVLRFVEDLPVTEVADLMSMSVRATESLLQRAKKKARAGRSAS